nr:MAG TPA: hypothetical protein [Caudoviricetes sp.]
MARILSRRVEVILLCTNHNNNKIIIKRSFIMQKL